MAGPKWPFEFFVIDFSAGALLLSLVAAYTLGTLGSTLDFGDAMLVAGLRAQVMAVLAGCIFAFGHILYLGTIALAGLGDATLLVFSVMGCAIGVQHLAKPQTLPSAIALIVFGAAAAIAVADIRVKLQAPVEANVGLDARSSAGKRTRRKAKPSAKAFKTSTKALITGAWAGLAFGAIVPALGLAERDQLKIGAYGGMLMASLGMFAASLFLTFFFLNVQLEGRNIPLFSYRTGTASDHLKGLAGGFAFAGGALALYAAYSANVGVKLLQIWLTPFAAAVLILISGLLPWRSGPRPLESFRMNIIGTVVFAAAASILIAGFSR